MSYFFKTTSEYTYGNVFLYFTFLRLWKTILYYTLTGLEYSICKTVPNFKQSAALPIDLILNTPTGNTYSNSASLNYRQKDGVSIFQTASIFPGRGEGVMLTAHVFIAAV